MTADQLQAFLLFGAPLRGLAIEKFRVYPAVEFVDIHRVNTVLKTVILNLNPADRVFVVLLLVAVANP